MSLYNKLHNVMWIYYVLILAIRTTQFSDHHIFTCMCIFIILCIPNKTGNWWRLANQTPSQSSGLWLLVCILRHIPHTTITSLCCFLGTVCTIHCFLHCFLKYFFGITETLLCLTKWIWTCWCWSFSANITHSHACFWWHLFRFFLFI